MPAIDTEGDRLDDDRSEATGPRGERLVVSIAAALSGLAVLVSTRHGIGANGTDSVAYLTMADDIVAGRLPYPTVVGVPPAHLPPGWSVPLALITAILPGVDTLTAARVVNVVFAGLLPVAIFIAVRYRARRPTWIPTLMAVVIAASYPLFELASRAVVEAVFLSLLVVALLAIERLSRHPSSSWLAVCAVLVSVLTLTRFVGVIALVPLSLAVLAITPTWGHRLGRFASVTLVVVTPTAAWYLLAPGGPENEHFGGTTRAGMSELLLSIREAGTTLARGDFLPDAVQLVIGLALLASPVLAVVLTSRALAPSEPWRSRIADLVEECGLRPWLWYLLVYTVLVIVERWSIDREVIARYWLPYWIITAVVLGRCLLEWTIHPAPSWRRGARIATVGLVLAATYNVAQVTSSARSNARNGITLNALEHQDSEVFRALEAEAPGAVYTDHVQLVEFQLYAREALVPIARISCRPETIDALVEELEAAAGRGDRPAVALVRACLEGSFVDDLLAKLDGAVVVRDRKGLVIFPVGTTQPPH